MTGFQNIPSGHTTARNAEQGGIVTVSAVGMESLPAENVAEEKKNEVIKENNSFKKEKVRATSGLIKKEHTSTIAPEERKEVRQRQVKKEVDPRLSRGLWMTIFGGLATALGIIFMAYAPTGLFVFAFGIVFLVGVITLIMYKANPKPKM